MPNSFLCQHEKLFVIHVHDCSMNSPGGGGGRGLPYERDWDAHRLA